MHAQETRESERARKRVERGEHAEIAQEHASAKGERERVERGVCEQERSKTCRCPARWQIRERTYTPVHVKHLQH
jgi:hypothetical protein